ncbi:hypothetical protein GCM10011502_04520 [Oceanisphaera marina]|uniref:Transcriptional regulator n=1 Tax=Oceanisphaera marina TaxID=2017550 RepID=A0ABQ1ICB6_9GAMM|nr:hypothetical protein [Oceanisphaera marina]GGB34562.1 hypothetical protein GCM10011502_04520 [Oceanisphaera marina]
MLDRKCCYTLKSGTDVSANITVHPCCTIEIEIPELHQSVCREVEQLHFKITNDGMLLMCDEGNDSGTRLHFSRKDALALCQIIDEVIEEHEELMSAL